ncbi:MAG: hypothetical protein M1820_006918 [Bogoriella megaspora]|nr:MAG: hypothetical protein M1820_006918 [Bogoriella megaspora]
MNSLPYFECEQSILDCLGKNLVSTAALVSCETITCGTASATALSFGSSTTLSFTSSRHATRSSGVTTSSALSSSGNHSSSTKPKPSSSSTPSTFSTTSLSSASGDRVAATAFSSSSTPPTPLAQSSSSSRPSGGAKAGIAVGVVAGVIIALFLAFFVWHRRKNSKASNNNLDPEGKEVASSNSGIMSRPELPGATSSRTIVSELPGSTNRNTTAAGAGEHTDTEDPVFDLLMNNSNRHESIQRFELPSQNRITRARRGPGADLFTDETDETTPSRTPVITTRSPQRERTITDDSDAPEVVPTPETVERSEASGRANEEEIKNLEDEEKRIDEELADASRVQQLKAEKAVVQARLKEARRLSSL